MIIRSQDKTMILNMECVANIYIYELEYVDTKRIVFRIETDKGFLGTYSTEEKAIKVMDMICDQYQYLQEFKRGLTEMGIQKVDFVLQMPQDSEV